jgi:heat shock protein HslJ
MVAVNSDKMGWWNLQVLSCNSTGHSSGSAGCNTYGTTYVTNKDEITVSAPAATRMSCAEPDGVMQQESAYLLALESAASYHIQQGVLELYDPSGALAVRFRLFRTQGIRSPTYPQ